MEDVSRVILKEQPHLISQFNLKDIQAVLETLSMYFNENNYDPTFMVALVD